MDREQAVMACVAEMKKHHRFAAATDDQKAKAADYAFERLHADAVKHLPYGASEVDVRNYGKAALKRVHQQISNDNQGVAKAAEFEQVNGFPILLVLGLLPTLWSWWKMFKEWMGW